MMLKVIYSAQPFESAAADGYFFLLEEEFEITGKVKEIQDKHYPELKEILKKRSFHGKSGQLFTLTAPKDGSLVHFVFVGIGKKNQSKSRLLELVRRGVGSVVGEMKRLDIKKGALQLPTAHQYGISEQSLAQQIATIAHLASYEFKTFITIDKNAPYEGELRLYSHNGSTGLEEAVRIGTIIGEATNSARQWINMPPNIMTPTALAHEAEKIAHEFGLKVTVFGRERALKEGMGGFCEVDAGSAQDGKFVTLEYKACAANAPTVAIVGKGVTFDTGGVSLKPSTSMSGMKYDMSGAAAVFATIKAIAQLRPNVNVVGLAPLVENMPSGSSSRQDDIISFMNGKTAEVKNTDAEGRLILADALCYAEKYFKPDVIVDLATLTGACVVALGHFYTAFMTRSEDVAKRLMAASASSGERLWQLPFDDDYIPGIKSKVADIANIADPRYGAGTITAGLFLEYFVEKTPWAHLDIAGTADGVPGISYLGDEGTGSGVRLLVDFIYGYQK